MYVLKWYYNSDVRLLIIITVHIAVAIFYYDAEKASSPFKRPITHFQAQQQQCGPQRQRTLAARTLLTCLGAASPCKVMGEEREESLEAPQCIKGVPNKGMSIPAGGVLWSIAAHLSHSAPWRLGSRSAPEGTRLSGQSGSSLPK